MKPLWLFAAVCLLSSLLAAQTTTSFHTSGAGASAIAHAQGTQISISVGRDVSSTLLIASSFTRNSDGSITQTFGIGKIPNDDFTNGGIEHMSLNVDTSQVPGFRSESCTFSFTPFFTSTCGQGPVGLIQVNWTDNNITSTSVVREDHRTIGGSVTIDSHVNSNESSADARGSFLGLSFPSVDRATVGLGRNTSITVTE